MVLRVNPNRMELLKLRKRSQVAKRGHKLLKDKLDELMRHFFVLVQAARLKRREVEEKLASAFELFILAQLEASPEIIEEALFFPQVTTEVKIFKKSLMNIVLPQFQLEQEGNLHCYSLGTTPASLDQALQTFNQALPLIVKLAELEKTVELLALEIEKNRRRVNALEYVLIPQLEEAVTFITMKLDEMERTDRTRLLKIKEMFRETAI